MEASLGAQSGEHHEDEQEQEEEVTHIPGWTPSVTLEVNDKVLTGEEHEEELYSQRSKLYRFRDGEWKERGLGDAKFLKDHETGKVRFVLRQEKTGKIVANHYVIELPPYCDLRPNAGSEKCWVWSAQDYAEEDLTVEQFALKFANAELAGAFQEAFSNAKLLNMQVERFSELVGSGHDAGTANEVQSEPQPTDTAQAPPESPQKDDQTRENDSASKAEEANPFAGMSMFASTPGSQGSLFSSSGSSADATASTFSGLFSQTSGSSGGLFSSAAASLSAPSSGSSSGGMFGSGGLFGVQTTGLFGSASGSSGGGLFGSSPVSNGAPAASTGSSLGLFSTPASSGSSPGLFSTPASSGSSPGLFSSAASSGSSPGLFSSAASSGSSPGLFSSAAASGSSPGLFSAAASSGSSTGLFSASSGSSLGLFSAPASSGSSSGLFSAPASGVKPANGQEKEEEEQEAVEEEEVTNIPGWTPSVTLDVNEQVETGEEHEEELYSQRSKLYRFRDGEWKERGLGEAKLLQHRETSRVRFMLRQEKTGKIVANHFVLGVPPYCDLQLNAGNKKCWVWSSMDYSEDEPQVERFALRFGTPELAEAFQEAFERAKELNATIEGMPQVNGKGLEKDEADGAKESAKGESAADAEGTSTQAEAPSPTLASSSPAKVAEPVDTDRSLDATASFKTGGLLGASSGGLFGGLSSSSTGGLFSGSSGGLFSAAGSSGSLFGSSSASSGGLFGSISGASSGGWSLTESPAAPAKAPEQDEEQYVVEEEVTSIPGWTPSVTLEVKDKVDTGEEDESELYSQRSKLYRFRDSEWKERGLGEAKLLQHRETGKVRFFMRQEKTGKIVANHFVVGVPPYCDLQPNAGSEKCWVWIAQDCSDGEIEVERLALKFGAAELATKFQEAFQEAKELNSKLDGFAELIAGFTELSEANDASPTQVSGKGGTESDKKGQEQSADASRSTSTAEVPKALGTSQDANPEKAEQPSNPFSGLSISTLTPEVSGGLFGASSGGFGNLFGSTSGSSGGLFGGLASGGLFGSSLAGTSTGLFSSSGSSSSSTASQSAAGSSSSSLFGSAGSSSGLFGSTGSSSLFGTSFSSTGGLFGSSSGASGGLFSSLAGALPASGGLFGTQSAADSQPSQGQTTLGSLGAGPVKADGAAPQQADDDQYVAEEEVTTVPGWAPSVTLEVKETIETGEEDEEELYSQRSKLYRFRDAEWKERGTGEAKILKHRKTGTVRFLLRQERTMKIVANHCIIDKAPYCDLRPNAGSTKCWVWNAQDCSDGEIVTEQFALKFGTAELANAFLEAFNQAKSPVPAVASEEPAQPVSSGAQQEEEEEEQEEEEVSPEQQEVVEDNDKAAPTSFAMLAQSQQQSGWQCQSCRLRWPEDVYECSVCEIARPGFEEKGAEKALEKQKGMQSAAAAFLGSSTQSKATGFVVPPPKATGIVVPPPAKAGGFVMPPPPPPAAQPPDSPQFGVSSTSTTSVPNPLFGAGFGASSGAAPLFQSAGSMFGAQDASSAPAPVPAFGASSPGIQAGAGASPAVMQLASPAVMQPPPAPFFAPPAAPPLAQPLNTACGMFGPQPAAALAAGALGGLAFGGMGLAPNPAMHPGAVAMPNREVPEPPGKKPDAALLAAIEEAVVAAQTKASTAGLASGPSRDGGVTEASLKRLEEQVRRLEDGLRSQEERCSRAEERARKADERARRAEDDLEDVRQQNASLKRRQQEVAESLEQLQRHQREDKQLIESLEKDLAQERLARRSLEGKSTENSDTLQNVLKVAESALKVAEGAQQDVRLLRQERGSDVNNVSSAVATVERSIEALESKMDRCSMDALRSMSMPNRITYLQGLHAQQTGRRLQGGRENGCSSALELKDAADEGSNQKSQPRPLLRCFP